jgi:methionine-rich copper-binding protein CopC
VVLAVLGLLGLGAALPAAAWAHAGLVRADPPPGGQAVSGVTRLELTFGPLRQDVSPAVAVTDASGADVVTGTTLVGGHTVEVAVDPLALGAYRLTYDVTSVDGHTARGSYGFDVVAARAAEQSEDRGRLGVAAAFVATVLLAGVVVVLRGRRHRSVTERKQSVTDRS